MIQFFKVLGMFLACSCAALLAWNLILGKIKRDENE